MRRESLLDEEDFHSMADTLYTRMQDFHVVWKDIPFDIRLENAAKYRRFAKSVYEAAQALEQAHRLAKLYEAMESENRPEGRQAG